MGLGHSHHHHHHGHHDHDHHDHDQGHDQPTSLDPPRALAWALALNFIFLIIEAAVGFLYGSISVLSDAAHMVADVAALAIAFVAQRLSSTGGGAEYTFGLRRLPVL